MADDTGTKSKGPVSEEGRAPTTRQTNDLGAPNPETFRERAENHPDGDPVLKAYKDALTADSGHQDARAHATIVKESPRASETPSGAAIEKVAGVSDDVKRGEQYLREKTRRRWGHEPIDE